MSGQKHGFLTATELARRIYAKELLTVEVIEAYLAQKRASTRRSTVSSRSRRRRNNEGDDD
jgi:hypothetical protein